LKIIKLLLLVALALVVKYWVFQPITITSNSMSNTLQKGDYTILNKWQKFFIGKSIQVKKNQVLAFHYPLDKGGIEDKIVYIKRCVGLPGDTLDVKNGRVEKNTTLKLKFDYVVNDPDNLISMGFLKKMNLDLEAKKLNDLWLLSMSEAQVKEFSSLNTPLKLKKITQHEYKFEPSIFPSDTLMKWNRDFYGPLYIPKSGDKISLNAQNISLYSKIIEIHENHTLERTPTAILIDDEVCETYTFNQNYYFFMGDNRHQSQDSRHWGFVPENHLIGTCTGVLFNVENLSAKRLLKSVH
jgi:signal peptidase I